MNFAALLYSQARDKFWTVFADMEAMFQNGVSVDHISPMARLLEKVAGASDILSSLDFSEKTKVRNLPQVQMQTSGSTVRV